MSSLQCWQVTGRIAVVGAFALRLGWNALRTRIKRRFFDALGPCFGCGHRAPPEPPQIRRLQERAEAVPPEAEPMPMREESSMLLATVASSLAELMAELLAFCSVPDVGRCSAASRDCRTGAEQGRLWRALCEQRWRSKQHSVHVRRWLLEVSPPSVEDLHPDFGCDEQSRRSQAAASQQPSKREQPRRCRVSSWKDRYTFAERDARRTAITTEELCWDSPCVARDGGVQLAGSVAEPQRFKRRWAMTLSFGYGFDLEGYFTVDGQFRDTGKFKLTPAAWRFIYLAHGEVMVQISPQDMLDFPPLQVARSSNWGWRLTTTGSMENMVIFKSQQLPPGEHLAHARIPSEIQTLYLRRSSGGGQPPFGSRSPFGPWRCLRGYKGKMLAPSWTGREIRIEPNKLTVTFTHMLQQVYRCSVDEEACTIDVMSSEEEEDYYQRTERCVYQLAAGGNLLVVTRNEVRGGERPLGPPEGLPTAVEVMRAEPMTTSL